jgi:hypothetical protein
MRDQISEDMLTQRLKRATAQISATTPVSPTIERSAARRQSGVRHRPVRGKLVRSRIAIVALLVAVVALASGTVYAGITLLESQTQTDAGAAAVYRQNLGVVLNLSQSRDGVRFTLVRGYADINRVMITYQVLATRPRTLFDGFATSTGEPSVADSPRQVLNGYDASFQTDARTGESVGIVVYDASMATVDATQLSLRVAIPELRMQSQSGTTFVGPFAFDFTVPVSTGQTIKLGRTISVRGVGVTFDRVVATPSETRIYLKSSIALGASASYLSAYITGPGYDSRTSVITTPAELVDQGSTFREPDGEEVVTFNHTLFGSQGKFTLTIASIGASTRVVGPWIVDFVVP